jgi:uncharacterized protein with GYD domain
LFLIQYSKYVLENNFCGIDKNLNRRERRGKMSTYFMFGKYSSEAIKGVSPERTKKANDIILKLGGEIVAQYGLLGYRDLVLIVNLPGVEEVFQASANLYKLTGVSFSSFPAITIEKFDEILT